MNGVVVKAGFTVIQFEFTDSWITVYNDTQ